MQLSELFGIVPCKLNGKFCAKNNYINLVLLIFTITMVWLTVEVTVCDTCNHTFT